MLEFAGRQLLDLLSPSNFVLDQPRSAAHNARSGRRQSRAGRAQLPGGLRARGLRQKADRSRQVRGRRNRRNHPGQGGLSQPADRADPVCAGNRQGLRRADPDRAGLDHEVLRARPVAAQLAGALPRRAGPHGVHDLLEEPDRRGSRPRPGRLSPARRDGGAGCGRRDRAGAPGARGRLLPRAAPCSRSPPRRWPATATTAWPR